VIGQEENAMRKGPDGKTISPGEDLVDNATRKVPRRSIRDRLLAADEEDSRPTRVAPVPGDEESTTQPGGIRTRAEPDEAPTMFPSQHVPLQQAPALQPAPRSTNPPTREPVLATAAAERVPTAPEAPAADPPATRIFRPNLPPMAPAPAQDVPAAPGKAGRPIPGAPVSADHTIADPLVGWLVVIEGPGRGTALTIGYGNNRIGRAPTENVSLDFGDELISRENHATLTFDGRHRRFYMLPGQGRNLVYVNDEPVMSPVEIKGGEDILLGSTKLRFVPFCSKAFDWYQK
jgi:hypothetical protein